MRMCGMMLFLSIACVLFMPGCNEDTCPECVEDTGTLYPCLVSEEESQQYEGEQDGAGQRGWNTLPGLEQDVLTVINETRRTLGLCPVYTDACLREVARAHSREMAANAYCDHVDLSGERVSDRLDAAGIPWVKCGEILGCQEPGADLVETVVAAWMISQAHRDTILNCQYTHTGIGICTDREGLYYLTVVFAAF